MNASDYTNKNIKKWSDKELVAVVSELKLCPGGLLREFERRDKLLTAVDLFLREEQGYMSNAVIASDVALSTPAKVERYGDELLTMWKKANTAHTRKALAECKASKISAFLRLFDDPSEASRTRAEECLKLFGEKVIQKAVFGSRMYKPEDIKSVLTRFSKSFNSLCPKELIKLFHDFGGGLASVREFVHANLSEWTNEELCDMIRNDISLRFPAVIEELARRRHFLLCMEIALEERNIPEAVHYADCELSVKIGDNAISTLSLWRRFIKPGDSMNTTVMAGASHISALLRLREDALSIMRSDKSSRMVTSFGPSFVSYALRFNGMPDDFAAFNGIKLFHESLRERICKKMMAKSMKGASKKKPLSHHKDLIQLLGDPRSLREHVTSVMTDTDASSPVVGAKDCAVGDSKKKGKRKRKKKRGKR
jgi:hypothetical protein